MWSIDVEIDRVSELVTARPILTDEAQRLPSALGAVLPSDRHEVLYELPVTPPPP
ncbi:MAG: hypothetical protein ACRDPT_10720 [Streptomycetales bacterium]